MSKLTLTFDNGPIIGATERILDMLAERDIKTTFFVVGQNLRDSKTRKLAERAHCEGHWIGNHTMRHSGPLGLSIDPDHPTKEIAEANKIIGELEHPDRLFRPQGRDGFGPHCLSKAAYDYCADYGHTIVTCTNIPRDGDLPPDGWIDRALAATREQDWAVTIVHDHRLKPALENLAVFLDRALAENVEFVQEFPETVLPMVRGEPRHPLETFVTFQ